MFSIRSMVHLSLVFALLQVVACTQRLPVQSTKLKPSWTEGLSLSSLLAEQAIVNSQQDLQSLLAKSWYAEIAVQNTNNIVSLTNCENYFANKAAEMRAARDSEHSAFVELQLACEAVRLMSGASASERSYLPQPLLAKSSPSQLPKGLALITSTLEQQKLMANNSVQYWGQINLMSHAENTSAYQYTYYSSDAEQKLSIIGRGDLNHDGIEDVLLLLQDSLKGGSYSHMRLFVLTVNSDNKWLLLEQF